MSTFFINIYKLFRRRRWLFYLLIAAFVLLILPGVLNIRFVEDISGSSDKSAPADRFNFVVSNFRFNEKLVLTLSASDTSGLVTADELCVKADTLAAEIMTDCGAFISNLFLKPNDTLFQALLTCTRNYLPVFLDSGDYLAIDTMTSAVNIENSIKRNYRQLISPASVAMKNQILGDPLGIQGLALKKLQSLKGSEQYVSYGGYIMSKDLRHLLIFITPSNPPGETGRNGEFLKKLDHVIERNINQASGFRAEYFGAAAVAVGNAERLKKDIMITLIIAFLAIFLLLGFYFRSILVPVMGLLPAVFGGGLAIAVLWLVKGSVSAIALGVGSVILGLIIDYSLYLINQYRRCSDIMETLKDMSQSIVVCALTSAGAFLCLIFLQSSVLHDLGWFAALSVSGAALFALVFLPQMFSERFSEKKTSGFSSFIDRIGNIQYHRSVPLIIIIGLLIISSLFFYKKAGFETDMNSLNYMEPGLKKAGDHLDSLSSGKLKNVYIVATADNMEEALRLNERIQSKLDPLIKGGIVTSVSGIRMLFLSDSLYQLRMKQWRSYMTPGRTEAMIAGVRKAAALNGFSEGAFSGFDSLAGKHYEAMSTTQREGFRRALFGEWLNEKEGISMVTSIARVDPILARAVYEELAGMKNVVVFDRQKLTGMFVERVRHDFDRLVLLSMVFVSLLLWFSFGRIELAVFTAIPMYLSWLITLGFMGATGIRFNIFNIIISSFIFGLGVDYSILMMRGIMHDYKYRTNNIASYRVSIILSSATTLFGVGAMFLAKHPALNSIALISVFGITVLVFITFTIQPAVAGWFITRRLARSTFPITARIFVKTIITWGNIVSIAMILAVSGSLMHFLLPVKRKWKENLFHRMFCSLSRAYIFLVFPNRKLINPYGEDFRKPAVIISNHQSLIETPALLRLYPKIIILTTTWVYNSPVFGPVARLASFYNVDHGLDSIMDKLRQKVSEGYSILIFPEAHRSKDHSIQRFHRGAFYLAEQLRLDILPIMMFGTGDFLEPGEFWGRPNMFRQKIYRRISIDDHSLGSTYQERTKAFRQFYKREYEQFETIEGNTDYFRRLLTLNYIYKGPVLEWYLRIKLMLEANYSLLNEYVVRNGDILDLGCGYGFISHMLSLTSRGRKITGVDYDEEKIRVAGAGFLCNSRTRFVTADVRNFEFTTFDCIILSDVLHYLPTPDQQDLIRKCMSNLRDDGMIIIRDADEDREEGHSRSMLTETLSTGIKFNKTSDGSGKMHFTSGLNIEKVAAEGGFKLEVIGSKSYSSNTCYLLRKNEREVAIS